jgi:hypothetical protein
VLTLKARYRWAKLSSTTFPEQAWVASARRRRRCPIRGRVFAGSSRPICRWDRGHLRTGISALRQLWWRPTSRSARPGSIRRALATTGFRRCAPAWEPFALARGESGAISCCSISFSSRMPEKYVQMTSKQRRNPKNSQPRQNWPAAAADSELPEATFAWCPSHGASGDYYAWGATDEICANVRPACANGRWTARRTPTRTI